MVKLKLKRILDLMIVREIKANYKQFISIILIACLSIALFTGLLCNYYHFQENVSALYEESNIGDLFVTTEIYDDNDYNYIKNNKLTKDINQRLYMNGKVKNEQVIIIGTDEKTISYPATITGEYGVLIDEMFAINNNIKITDLIAINIKTDFVEIFGDDYEIFIKDLDPYLIEGKENFLESEKIEVFLKVTGLMTHAEATSNSRFSSGLLYTSTSTIRDSLKEMFKATFSSGNELYDNLLYDKSNEFIDNIDLYNQYIIKTDNVDELKEDIDNYFLDKEDDNLLVSLTRKVLPSTQTIEADILQAKQLLFVFPFVFYLVGVLVIITSLSQLINKERMNIGIMSSLGISKTKIIMHYSKFSIFLTGIGGIIGMILGPVIVPYAMNKKYELLYQVKSVDHPWFYWQYFICFIVLFLISFVVSLLVSRSVVNQYPASIVRNMPVDNFKGVWLEKIPKLFNKLGISMRMALRNIKRKMSRSIMVIIGILGCTALLLCGFGIIDTLDYGIDKELYDLVDYDISVNYNEVQTGDKLKSINNVKSVDLYQKVFCMAKFENNTIDTDLLIMETDSIVFKAPYDKKGCSITTKAASDLNLEIGDTITIILDNSVYEYKITNVIELCFTQGIIIDKNLIGFDYEPNQAFIRINNKDEVNSTRDEINKISNIVSTTTKDDLLETADNLLSGIRIITLIIKIFALLLAIAVVFNLAQLNFKERIRDIATLKVLGFDHYEIGKTLLYEIMILSIVGEIIGLFCGMPLLQLVLTINETPLIAYIYHINFESYIYTILLTLGVSVAINLVIAKLSDKIEMVESLKSVE